MTDEIKTDNVESDQKNTDNSLTPAEFMAQRVGSPQSESEVAEESQTEEEVVNKSATETEEEESQADVLSQSDIDGLSEDELTEQNRKYRLEQEKGLTTQFKYRKEIGELTRVELQELIDAYDNQLTDALSKTIELIKKQRQELSDSFDELIQNKEDEIAQIEEQLKNKKAEADDIGSRVIPELLAEQGLSEIKLADISYDHTS